MESSGSLNAEADESSNVPEVVPSIQDVDDKELVTKLSFNDMDSILEDDNAISEVEAPKSIERLEDISTARALQRKLEEEEEEDDERLQISTEPIDLSGFDILDEPVSKVSTEDILLNDIEELPPI